MKLDIEAMAREADLLPMTADAHCREDYWTATRAELEALARLIVERCAQECEQTQTGLSAHGDFFSERCAKRVRKLLEEHP